MQNNITPVNNNNVNGNTFSLLSINEVRKMLRLRHATVTKLVNDGKIKHKVINKRKMIPLQCLNEFMLDNDTSDSGNKALPTIGTLNSQVDELIRFRRIK